ncbi:TylF/MycF/NovP-related O-methyltransferase [Rhizobium leguminosarum]|uniref:Asparagine synthase n=1 Tax=Rhizobium leguminosarum TaxID=384 RepID=A0A7K3VSH7_RHILE|nr:TylF/MycF/NovP-related O-methyltransferase [Rhizobium leguminosarum]NEK19478.1 asparagine synthase [Rhizobium leguminosarum]
MKAVHRVARGARWRLNGLLERARRTAYPRAVRQAWSRVRTEYLSYTTDPQLHQLLEVVRRTAPSGALIIEAGCARGGSAILMCSAKSPQRPMRVYDLFEMLPPPSEHDGDDMKARYAEINAGEAVGLGGGQYYLYDDDLMATVTNNFARFGYPVESNNVQLIKGKVQDTLTVAEPVALANIDVDWYEPVSACLERVMPHLIVGGAVALHAYSDWSGCRKAADDYFSRAGREGLDFDLSAGHMLVTRTH